MLAGRHPDALAGLPSIQACAGARSIAAQGLEHPGLVAHARPAAGVPSGRERLRTDKLSAPALALPLPAPGAQPVPGRPSSRLTPDEIRSLLAAFGRLGPGGRLPPHGSPNQGESQQAEPSGRGEVQSLLDNLAALLGPAWLLAATNVLGDIVWAKPPKDRRDDEDGVGKPSLPGAPTPSPPRRRGPPILQGKKSDEPDERLNYQPDGEQHRGRGWRERMDLDDTTAQDVLNRSRSIGGQPEPRYAFHDGQFYVFMSNRGTWYGYRAKPEDVPLEMRAELLGLKYKLIDKHHPVRGWDTRMDLDDKTAQEVLLRSTAVGKQRYAIHNGKGHEFKFDNSGTWHGYPVLGNKVPEEIRMEALRRGEINQTAYNRMRKGLR